MINGEIDGTLAMKDAFRSKYMIFSDPVYDVDQVLFYYKNYNPIGSYKDNSNYQIIK